MIDSKFFFLQFKFERLSPEHSQEHELLAVFQTIIDKNIFTRRVRYNGIQQFLLGQGREILHILWLTRYIRNKRDVNFDSEVKKRNWTLNDAAFVFNVTKVDYFVMYFS